MPRSCHPCRKFLPRSAKFCRRCGWIVAPQVWRPALKFFLHPYVQLALGAVLVTASELLLRHGAHDFGDATGLAKYLGIAALGSWWTWLGIISYILSFVSWLHVLR